MMALYLARRDHQVEVFERRPDLRRADVQGPSMNLGLSRRGIEALRAVGLLDRVLRLAIPMSGRVVHDEDGGTAFQPYGRNGHEVIQAVRRNDINAVLLDAAEETGNVRLRFGQRCVGLDRETGTAQFQDEAGGATASVQADFWVGADGLFSAVRRAMQHGLRADYQQEYLDWGWKELRVPAGPGGSFLLQNQVFHLWPRGGSLLFAHPNLDSTFTCSLVLPLEGEASLASLDRPERVREFFAAVFPDLPPLVPDLAEQFLRSPVVSLVTVRTSPWHHRDRVVLLGDSAHAVVPFYAQGMNAAFEDCAVLDDCLASNGDRAAAFSAYQARRKRDTDALSEMSKQNFLELRDRVRSPWLRARRRLDNALNRWLGERWAPLHARVTNTTIPYADALALERRQDRIVAWSGAGLGLAAAAALYGALGGGRRRARHNGASHQR
jgi:kynurenine 3-monooxygenase